MLVERQQFSSYVKLVTLYCHAIFWGTEGLREGCVEIMQIVSCLELMADLFIFIHNWLQPMRVSHVSCVLIIFQGIKYP